LELTKRTLKDLRTNLAEWRTPGDLRALSCELRNEIGRVAFFNKGGMTFVMEAIVAADFAIARDASRVRLVLRLEERPDFELTLGHDTERFEMVEADCKGRRRGDEYRRLAKLPPGSVYELPPPPSDAEVVRWVEAAAQKKAKPYPPGTQLLIYLNALVDVPVEADTDGDKLKFDTLLPDFQEAVGAARPFFSAIWITWHGLPQRV
jgi:hypothetical protein